MRAAPAEGLFTAHMWHRGLPSRLSDCDGEGRAGSSHIFERPVRSGPLRRMKVLVPLVGRANSKVLFHFPPTLNRCPPVFMHSSRLIAMLSVALMSLVDAAPAPAVVKPVF